MKWNRDNWVLLLEIACIVLLHARIFTVEMKMPEKRGQMPAATEHHAWKDSILVPQRSFFLQENPRFRILINKKSRDTAGGYLFYH